MTDTLTPHPDPEPAVVAAAEESDRRIRRGLRLFPTPWHYAALAATLVLYAILPLLLSDLWAKVFVYAGILAIAGLGLNLLTGVAGQASLGSAAFVAIGAFTASYLGRATDLNPAGKGQPFYVYFLVAIAVGGAVGFVVGLPALRLRGPYLVIVTLGLVYATVYVLAQWTVVSNGGSGVPSPRTLLIGQWDFRAFDIFGLRDTPLGKSQSLSYLVWAVVGVTAVLVRNLIRSRPGRALQAIRDRDVAAEVVGISLFRYKIGAFVVSSAIASAAGVFFVHSEEFIRPDTGLFGLALSVALLSVVVVGGVGSMSGTIIGAVIIGSLPTVVREYGTSLPFVSVENVTAYGDIVIAALLVLTLVTQPGGIAALLAQLKHWLVAVVWPAIRKQSPKVTQTAKGQDPSIE